MAPPDGSLQVEITRRIRAPVDRVYAAWTEPHHLMGWWGPQGVECPQADVDLRVGGSYRLANRMPTGEVVWIEGVFERIDPQRELIYSWHVGSQPSKERVTVRFVDLGEETEVHILHERIATERARDGHEGGWHGCLDGLSAHLLGPPAP